MGEDDTTEPAEAVDDAAAPSSGDEASSFARRYPPLLSILAGILIALFALPSSLNLPQTNPTQTLEYAPVPPEDSDDPPPPDGNFDRLGLGSSAGLEGDGALGGDGAGGGPGDALRQGIGEDASDFRCVRLADGVVHQTEDPLSPPCVPFFDGDNFGATYQGVTEDEIRIVLYYDGAIQTIGTSRGSETCPPTTMYDLLDEPTDDECQVVRQARIWQKYFNLRYQTYDRFVHFYIYFGTRSTNTTPETRRADAAEAFRLTEPFATLDYSEFAGGGDSYVDSMARRGVLNFGQFAGQKASFFAEFPKLVWGYQPSQEIQVQQFASALCNYYVDRPVQHSPQFTGQRKFGLVYTTDRGYEVLQEFKDRVVSEFRACGGSIAAEGSHPKSGYSLDPSTSPRYATEVMARFQQAGVTTVIWPGGLEVNYTAAAKNLNYYPEWIVAGDGDMDNEFAQEGYQGSAGQDPDVWDHAVVVSNQPLVPVSSADRICFQAQRSVDPSTPVQDAAATGCDMYNNLRQLFTGIQVAGPRLGPTSIDRGFHAIPAVESQDLQIPACYYLPGDYTCIKDFVLADWDPTAEGSNSTDPGCYRIVASRRRTLAGVTRQDPLTGYNPAVDPCLGYGSGFRFNTAPPDPNEL
ncbi:MAG: hypothetical protein ACRDYW_11700 [Acidimicrobiales bacterium]